MMRIKTITMAGAALMALTGVASAQTLGGVGAAGAISSGMNAQSASGTMAVGARAMQDARRLGAAAGAPGLMEEGASGAGGAIGAPGAMGASGAEGAAATSGAAAGPKRRALYWSSETGSDMINELMASSRVPARSTYPARSRRRLSQRAQANYARRVARMTPAQRKRLVMSKYKKPPVSWLAFYLPEDRYKLTSGIWKFVSIEDDRARYPVRYYYRPSAAPMLRLLSVRPRNSQPRYNRVIGFNSWQDALIAGYRPDPVSQPEPGAQLAHLARLTRGPQLASYVEFVYSGQVSPEIFARNFAYLQRVERIVNSKPYTRPYMRATIDQVLGAALGENPLPRFVGPRPPTPVTTQTTGGEMGGAMPGGAPGSMPGAP